MGDCEAAVMKYQRGNNTRKLPAGITVEASYVMAIVILSLAVLIRTAYAQWRKTAEVMDLHYHVEQARYQEGEVSRNLSRGMVEKRDDEVEGYIDTGRWKKEISVKIYEPEKLLRKIAVFEQE